MSKAGRKRFCLIQAIMSYELHHGDCLEIMPRLVERFDGIFTDVPYGTTACSWDTVIPLDPMWVQVKRLLKPNGAFITTASQPFTSALIMSNLKAFRICWYWRKERGTNFQKSRTSPMKVVEECIVFSFGTPNYNPLKTPIEKPYKHVMPKPKENHSQNMDSLGIDENGNRIVKEYSSAFPENALYFPRDNMSKGKSLHPTQKPVALYEYLIRTYSSPGDTILDFAMGSGTTGVAAIRTGRHFVGIEKELEYFEIAQSRISSAQPALFVEDAMPANSSSSGIVGTGAKKSTQLSMALGKESSQQAPQSAEH